MAGFAPFSKEVMDFIQKHENDDPYALALKKSPFPEVDNKTISQQVMGRKIARKKFPFLLEKAQYRYPKKVSLEQASSEATGRFKAQVMDGASFVDLTGGMGIDTFLLGNKFKECVYVEPNSELATLTRHNFAVLGFDQCKIWNTSCENFLNTEEQRFDWAYIDPSRRIEGSRKISIQSYEPNVVELQDQLIRAAENVMIKLSPMQDITECVHSLKGIRRIWVVSVHNEVKELLIHLNKKEELPTTISAINIQNQKVDDFTIEYSTTSSEQMYSKVGNYIYQPNASIIKAGIQNQYAEQVSIKKLHPNTQLFTQNERIEGFQGRIFKVESLVSLNKKEIHRLLPDGRANIISKNYPLSAEELSKKLKVKSGGEQYILAFTDIESKKVIALCSRLQ